MKHFTWSLTMALFLMGIFFLSPAMAIGLGFSLYSGSGDMHWAIDRDGYYDYQRDYFQH